MGQRLGYEIVIFPASAFRVAAGAVQQLYGEACAERRHVKEMLPQMMTRAALYDTIGYYDYEVLKRSPAPSCLILMDITLQHLGLSLDGMTCGAAVPSPCGQGYRIWVRRARR